MRRFLMLAVLVAFSAALAGCDKKSESPSGGGVPAMDPNKASGASVGSVKAK
ncbi:MAG TPA: hypothetical protein VHR66_29650 [Gemmataceae bacterium]|jgi:hypothetical protein|nr:hypothetical protein [Gemmataceae bacterium]